MRTSKAVAVLEKHEAELKAEHQRLIAELAGIEAALARVKDMRSEMQALPKRVSRAKRVLPPAKPSDSTADLLQRERDRAATAA